MQLTLFDEPQRSVPASIGPARVSVSDSSHILTPGQGSASDFDYTLNPYRGCSFGCSYCFAAFFVADDEMRADWGKWVEVKIRAVDMLRKKDVRGKRVFMSSATDPYQPVERQVELTRGIVEELARQQARLVVQTRSPIVVRDIDLFKKFDCVRVNMSITTDTDSIRKDFEPGCASVERRLEAVAELVANGIDTCVCVAPMLPMHDPEAFGRKLQAMGVPKVTAYKFRVSDRKFAASTREPALEMAKKYGWSPEEFETASAALKRGYSALTTDLSGFAPA